MKKINSEKALSWILIYSGFVFAIAFYAFLPDTMVSHWGMEGEPNGYASKNLMLFLLPALGLFLYLLFLFLPKADPMKENFKHFEKEYNLFILFFVAFMFYLEFLVLLWNLGGRFNMNIMIIPAFSLLFYYIGHLLAKAKRNWFIGIRTPWTLSSDEIWQKTNVLSGRLFKLLSFALLIGLIYPKAAFFILLIGVFGAAIFSFIYSYSLFKKSKKKK